MARPLSRALEDHVVEWQRVPWPAPWAQIFARSAPLALEIGFGNGAFLAEQAALRGDRDHVGIELSWTAATHLFRRLAHTETRNVRVLLGDAEALLRHLFAPLSLCEVSVNHPCPWPKARHHARRLLRRDVLALLAERMQPAAVLTVVTDHAEYAAWLADELAAVPALASCHATAAVPALPGRSVTKYQQKAMAQGLSIHYFQWRMLGSPAAAISEPRATPPPHLPAMPTLTLSGAPPSAKLFRAFHPQLFREVHAGVEVVVKLAAVYHRADVTACLVETLVHEDKLAQAFGIDVVLRGTDVLVKPALIGYPYPTHGVKRAVWCAARWLQSRHPALVVRHESLGLAPPDAPWPPEAPRS
jgi:tRNA (guanine-N7-)-methyltransferase